MKKLLTLALAASMTLALSVNTFALGNYVLATDELGTEDETPADEVLKKKPQKNQKKKLQLQTKKLLFRMKAIR